MSKAIEENKLTVAIRRLFKRIQFILEIYVYRLDAKNKTNLPPPSPQPPPPPSTPVTVFLIAEKLLSLWIWNLQTSSLYFLTVLRKIKSNCRSGLFCMANLLELVKKNIFFNFVDFNPLQAKIK